MHVQRVFFNFIIIILNNYFKFFLKKLNIIFAGLCYSRRQRWCSLSNPKTKEKKKKVYLAIHTIFQSKV
jgi:hypothetical protein